MKKFILLCVCVGGWVLGAYSQSLYSALGYTGSDGPDKALMKQYSKEIKKAKDAHKAKDAYVVIAPDGYKYIVTYKKSKENSFYSYRGICDMNGTSIVPFELGLVTYRPAIKNENSEDKVLLFNWDSYSFYWGRNKISHIRPKCEATFVREGPGYKVYGLDGRVLLSAKDFGYNAVLESTNENFGYCIVKKDKGVNSSALFSQDGKIQFTDFVYDDFKMGEKGVCPIRVVNGSKYMGFFDIHRPQDSIPSIFYDVMKLEYGQILVKKHANDEYVDYDPSMAQNKVTYRDDGEKYFDAEDYQKVVDFYQKDGISQPWAKYFTGKSIFQLSRDVISSQEFLTRKILKNDWNLYELKLREKSFGKNVDKYFYGNYEVVRNSYQLAVDLLQAYLNSGNTEYKLDAEREIRKINNYIRESYTNEQNFKQAVSLIQQYEAVKQRKAYEEAQVQAQRQAQIWNSVIGAFTNALTNGNAGGVSQSVVSGGSSYVPSSSSSSSSYSSSSSSSSSSSGKKEPTYRQCKKCGGTGDIFTTSTVATYGLNNDKKVVCSKCGKEHWKSTVHHHHTCSNCNGTGKVEVK